MSVFLLGSTGLVGSFILQNAVESSAISSIITLSRSQPKAKSEKLHAILESNTDNWPQQIQNNATKGSTFVSSFGTTRAKAGGIENFKKIDHGVNFAAAKAAKSAGTDTFILISSMGASSSSMLPYLKSKGQLEDDIIALKFPRVIIIRPGALIGERSENHGLANDMFQWVASKVYGTPLSFLTYGVYARDIGKIVVDLVNTPIKSDNEVRIIGPGELISMAKALPK